MPPSTKIKLGLDLKGGVHLVLKVETDEALKVETETASGSAAGGAEDGADSGDGGPRRPA